MLKRFFFIIIGVAISSLHLKAQSIKIDSIYLSCSAADIQAKILKRESSNGQVSFLFYLKQLDVLAKRNKDELYLEYRLPNERGKTFAKLEQISRSEFNSLKPYSVDEFVKACKRKKFYSNILKNDVKIFLIYGTPDDENIDMFQTRMVSTYPIR